MQNALCNRYATALILGGGVNRFLTKTARVMQLTAILLTVCCFSVLAKTMSQSVTYSAKDVKLQQVFEVIKRQTGFFVFFHEKNLEKANPVTINAQEMPLTNFLDLLLENQPFSYSIQNTTITIKVKPEKKAADLSLRLELAETPPIRGIVRSADGQPLSGVNIVVKGTSRGTTSRANGSFEIDAKVGDKLMISSVGYAAQEVAVSNTENVLISLTVSTSPLDEVQIIAYGTTTKRFSTGNVSTVKSEDIAKAPVQNPLLAIQGRVPGLQITQSTGMPGSGVRVLIQGQNSLGNGNDPFYVIDGVPFPSQLLTNQGYVLGNSQSAGSSSYMFGNPLSYINPLDIESIDVLKDASATAIYGSRAANGAILITTKKGKAGKTKFDINLQNGWGKVTRKLDLMNVSQYLEMRHEALNNSGLTPSETDYDLNGTWDTTHTIDWQKEIFGNTSMYTNVQANMIGGSGGTSFLLGANYNRETTVFPGDFSNQKGSFHFNVNNVSADNRFKAQLTGSFLYGNNQLPATDMTEFANYSSPVAPPLYNSDGSLNWAIDSTGKSRFENPFANFSRKYKNKTTNLTANFVLGYEVIPGLEIKSSFGYSNLDTKEITTTPLTVTNPEYYPLYGTSIFRTADFGNGTINTWSIEPQTTYRSMIWKGKLQAIIGTTITQTTSTGQQISASNFNTDELLTDIASAGTWSISGTTSSVYKYFGVFGRLNYNLLNEYIIDFTARKDGSSRFGSANKFHDFEALGFGWIFSSRPFIQRNFPFISYGKLRGSYGTIGSDQIRDYRYLDLYGTVWQPTLYQNAQGLQVTGLPNPYLQWEETRKLQFGLNLGFLNDKILLDVGYFHNRSSNQLLSYALSGFTGFYSVTRNFPATVQNTGWELALSINNIGNRDFKWSANINLTVPQNKLVAFENLSSSAYSTTYTIGEPVSMFKAYNYYRVDPEKGTYTFIDSKGNVVDVPNYTDDRIVSIYPDQKFYGGFQNSFNYKGLELDLLFSFVKQIGMAPIFGVQQPGPYMNNNMVRVLDRWRKPGDIATNQRFDGSSDLFSQWISAHSSNAAYTDASYIRLKNLSISWQLPQHLIKRMYLQNLRLFAQGQNLLTITDYVGLDPETLSSTSLPPLRVFTFGLRVSL